MQLLLVWLQEAERPAPGIVWRPEYSGLDWKVPYECSAVLISGADPLRRFREYFPQRQRALHLREAALGLMGLMGAPLS